MVRALALAQEAAARGEVPVGAVLTDAQAIAFARLGKLVYAAYDPKAGGVDHGPRIFEQPGCNHRPEVISGFQEQAASALLKEFFAARR